MHIIELRDSNLRVSGPEGIVAESPGFASLAPGAPVYGEEARRQFRLHPRQSFNQFWAQLSLDPLANTNDHFRHQADVAYGHLNHLLNQHGLEGDAVFAIPSHYSRNQLAILLGVARQLPLRATGLVDLAVAAASGLDIERAVYLDMQLHQSVLTRLVNEDGRLRREAVAQVPGAGLQALQDAWSNMITDVFIKQSRFDPRHNAETEQYIYDRLPDWLETAAGGELVMEINHRGSIYQASVNRGNFEQKARGVLGKIREEIDSIAEGAELLLPERVAALPGPGLYLPAFEKVAEDAAAAACLQHLEQIQGDPDGLAFVTSLPARGAPRRRAAAKVQGDAPSHVLVNDSAYPLPSSLLCIGPRPAAGAGSQADYIEVNDPAFSSPITISRNGQGYRLEVSDNGALRVNGEAPEGVRPLALGDRINFVNSPVSIQLIQVR